MRRCEDDHCDLNDGAACCRSRSALTSHNTLARARFQGQRVKAPDCRTDRMSELCGTALVELDSSGAWARILIHRGGTQFTNGHSRFLPLVIQQRRPSRPPCCFRTMGALCPRHSVFPGQCARHHAVESGSSTRFSESSRSGPITRCVAIEPTRCVPTHEILRQD